MTVEIPLKPKYLKVTNGKVRTRSGGGNSARKNPGKHQNLGLRIEGELKKTAQAQTEANRKVLVIDGHGRRRWLPRDLYEGLVKGKALHAYLAVRGER